MTVIDTETGLILADDQPASLVMLGEARRYLAEAHSVDDVKAMRDKAEAMRVYAQQAKLGLEAQNCAAEIKLRAERRAGELLREMPKNEGVRLSGRDAFGGHVEVPPKETPTLSDLGISKNQSSTWQQLAALPEAQFEAQIEAAKSAGDELTTSGMMREVQRTKQTERREEKREQAQSLPDQVFNVIYADPAWEYDNTGLNGAAEHHYSTMSIEDIYNLPRSINLCVADNAVLFLWVTNPFLAEGLECVRRWGFNYKTNLAWVKTELEKPGVGWYVRGRHELLLIATRGSFTPLDAHISPPIGSVLEAPIQEHSRKPDEVYAIIERLYPDCNYIELFARRAREGWLAWGDEVGASTR